MTKVMKEAYINELMKNGEAYIGSMEIMGVEKIVKAYKSLSKEIEKRFPGMILCMNNENGMIWMA